MVSDKYTKVSFMVFRTGSCLIVGNCTEEVLMFVYEFVKKVLTDEYKNIYVEGDEETPESKKAQKKTKLRKRKMMVTPDYFSNIKKIDA